MSQNYVAYFICGAYVFVQQPFEQFQGQGRCSEHTVVGPLLTRIHQALKLSGLPGTTSLLAGIDCGLLLLRREIFQKGFNTWLESER